MTDLAAQPPRLQYALQLIQQLAAREIYFLPVRHHSPACAYAALQALREIQPAHILIEGPSSFNRLIADLQHADSRPPLAVLCQTEIKPVPADSAQPEAEAEAAKQYRTAYFPFCEYSPEWVALREAPALQAGVEFIDLDWSSQVEHEQQASAQQTWQSRSLQQERYLAHSQYIQLLARKLQSLIDQDGQRAREAMEMSQEHAPELSLISQEQPPTRWGTSLTNSDSMHSLLSRLDWTKPGKVQSLPQPSDLQSLLEHLP